MIDSDKCKLLAVGEQRPDPNPAQNIENFNSSCPDYYTATYTAHFEGNPETGCDSFVKVFTGYSNISVEDAYQDAVNQYNSFLNSHDNIYNCCKLFKAGEIIHFKVYNSCLNEYNQLTSPNQYESQASLIGGNNDYWCGLIRRAYINNVQTNYNDVARWIGCNESVNIQDIQNAGQNYAEQLFPQSSYINSFAKNELTSSLRCVSVVVDSVALNDNTVYVHNENEPLFIFKDAYRLRKLSLSGFDCGLYEIYLYFLREPNYQDTIENIITKLKWIEYELDGFGVLQSITEKELSVSQATIPGHTNQVEYTIGENVIKYTICFSSGYTHYKPNPLIGTPIGKYDVAYPENTVIFEIPNGLMLSGIDIKCLSSKDENYSCGSCGSPGAVVDVGDGGGGGGGGNPPYWGYYDDGYYFFDSDGDGNIDSSVPGNPPDNPPNPPTENCGWYSGDFYIYDYDCDGGADASVQVANCGWYNGDVYYYDYNCDGIADSFYDFYNYNNYYYY